MELPREYISYSQIRLYQNCPKKYYYIYVKKIPVPVNEKIFLGIVFHAVVEKYFKEKINGTELSKEVITDYYFDKFEDQQKEQEVKWEITRDKNFERGSAFVNYFFRHLAQSIEPLMVEKELIVMLPELGVPLKGVIDLVETNFSITDFKTTTARWSKARIKGHYLQIIIYRYLFEKSFGDVITQLKFQVIFSKTSSPLNVNHQEVAIKPKDVDFNYEKMLDIIKYVVDGIRQEVFYKNESYLCGFCEFKDLCRTDVT